MTSRDLWTEDGMQTFWGFVDVTIRDQNGKEHVVSRQGKFRRHNIPAIVKRMNMFFDGEIVKLVYVATGEILFNKDDDSYELA